MTTYPRLSRLRERLPLDKLPWDQARQRPDFARIKKQFQPRTALALTLGADGTAVSLVRLHLDDAGRDVQPARRISLTADDVNKNPEKAGALLAAELEAAGLREKRCAVCVPASWALTASTDLPAVAPDDLRGYLELRAEREFPVALHELRLAYSAYTLPDGTRRATLAALPARRMDAVVAMLTAAGRRALSISLALGDTLAAEAGDATPTLHFLSAPSHTDLIVTVGDGVAALRSLPGPNPEEAPDERASASLAEPPTVFDPTAFVRDVRITLGRLPQALTQNLSHARFGGAPEFATRLRREVRDPLWRMGVESLEEDERAATPATTNTTAENAAARSLRREAVPFEFVIPQLRRLEAVYSKYNTQLYRKVAAVAACLIFLPLFFFVARHWYEGHLASQWDAMHSEVTELDGLQQKIRKFHPWFDPNAPTVRVLDGVFEAFPEAGDVWAKSIQVNATGVVTCTGFARNQPALLALTDRLRKKPGVTDVAVKSLRGENPVQFTLNCQWGVPR